MRQRRRVIDQVHDRKVKQEREAAALAREVKKARCMHCGKPVTAEDRVQDGWLHQSCAYQTSTRR